MSKLWIPEGPRRDLNVEHSKGEDAGAIGGGGPKLVWHITVSPWMAVDSMVRVLRDKNAAPHFVIGGRPGFRFPVLVQMLALNRAGRALAHPSGPETNRANCVQVEICAVPGNARVSRADRGDPATQLFTMPDLELPEDLMRAAAKADNGSDAERSAVLDDIELCMSETSSLARGFNSGVAAWGEDTYKALANLTRMISAGKVPRKFIPMDLARKFTNTDRFSGTGFVKAKGHCGHMHVPGNTHFDPTTAFEGSHLIRLAKAGWHQL